VTAQNGTPQPPVIRQAASILADCVLPGLQADFPHYRIWQELTGGRTRYIARSRTLGACPHTLVTTDPSELRAALTPAPGEPYRPPAAVGQPSAATPLSPADPAASAVLPAPASLASEPGDDDADRWREAIRLRKEHPGWIVLWLDRLQQYRAYPLVQNRHRKIMTAPDPADLATLIQQADLASARKPPAGGPGAAGLSPGGPAAAEPSPGDSQSPS
jgi:hypothetical protein